MGWIKAILAFFWAVWFTVVLATNTCAGLKRLGALPEGWKFASGNLKQIEETTSVYHAPAWINALLFSGVVAWQALAAVSFWIGAFSLLAGRGASWLTPGFALGLALWAMFMLSDEIFLSYQKQTAHMEIFLAQLASLLVIQVH